MGRLFLGTNITERIIHCFIHAFSNLTFYLIVSDAKKITGSFLGAPEKAAESHS